MGIIRGIGELLYSVWCLMTLIACLLCYLNITSYWLASFLMMSLPVLMLGHVLVMILAALSGSSLWIRAILLIALFYPLASRLYNRQESDSDLVTKESIKVVSFNLLRFDERKLFYDDTKLYEADFKAWLKAQDADVLCLQEYNYFKGDRRNITWKWFEEQGYRYFAGNATRSAALTGPVIIAKYPLINKDYKDFGALNGLVSADMIVGQDTLSIVSVHLHSMTLKLGDLLHQKSMEKTKEIGKVTVDKMKEGWEKRKLEVVDLEDKIVSANHPLIICGDFNETPFSYVYGKINDLLSNAFEEKGSGFGFTFNQLPYFIRIDNQFFDASRLAITSFVTDTKVKFSDHYPIVGTYEIKR